MNITILRFLVFFVMASNAFALTKKKNVKDCKEVVEGPCYEFPGRARLYNNRYVRVWKKGTNRLYEITSQTETVFSDLKHLGMSTEINGIFDVCLLKPEAPSGIAEMCVQSVKNLKTSHMPE